MLCRATNALISVRLDYNNFRKKYRNFCLLMYLFFFNYFYLFSFLCKRSINESLIAKEFPKYVALKTAESFGTQIKVTVKVEVIGALYYFCSIFFFFHFHSKLSIFMSYPPVIWLSFH